MSNENMDYKKRLNLHSNYIIMLDTIKFSHEPLIKKAICEKVLEKIFVDGDPNNILKKHDYTIVMAIANKVLKDDEFQYVLDETIGSCIVELNEKINKNTNQPIIENNCKEIEI